MAQLLSVIVAYGVCTMEYISVNVANPPPPGHGIVVSIHMKILC